MTMVAVEAVEAPPTGGPRWQERAACRGVDPDLFFPMRGADTTEAVAVCATCAVRAECLTHALAFNERQGIWGGTTGADRRRLRRQGQHRARRITDTTDNQPRREAGNARHTDHPDRHGGASTQVRPGGGTQPQGHRQR